METIKHTHLHTYTGCNVQEYTVELYVFIYIHMQHLPHHNADTVDARAVGIYCITYTNKHNKMLSMFMM